MQWIEAKVTLSEHADALIVDLIADVFYQLDAKGVVVDDPLLEPPEAHWAPDAVPRPDKPGVTGYLPVDEHLESRRHHLEQNLVRLGQAHGFSYRTTYTAMDDEDWAESWKRFFHPQKITPAIVVKPTWRDYIPEPEQIILEIDPGMAFGTGTHPTTVLCIQLLEKYLCQEDRVLDVGTGSGILLIAAAKLGAGPMTGIDLDPMAVAIARKNLIQNKITAQQADLLCGHLVDTISQAYDLVIANILAEVILEFLDAVVHVVRPGGLFICSGIIEAYQMKVTEKMAACGFDILDVRKSGDWVALVGRLTA
jgi:ribosomal protein L11 methyltransferase